MLFRPTAEGDLDGVLACEVTEPISWIVPDRYRAGLADRQYRPDWTWVAEQGDRFLARALWWGFPHSDHPLTLDCVYVHESVPDRVRLAADLLTVGHDAFRDHGAPAPPEFHLNLPRGWRDDPAVSAALRWRREAAARAGLTRELERLRYKWTPDAGVPGPTARLALSAEPNNDTFLAAFRRIAEGSLDVTTRRNSAAMGADRQAREDMDFYLGLPGERDWWRLAHIPNGQLAGLAIPSLTGEHVPSVGYLGVVPELRGHRYVDDLLAEITRFHATTGAPRVTGTTDTTNLPMAAAFERAGYRNTDIRMVLSAPPATAAAKERRLVQ